MVGKPLITSLLDWYRAGLDVHARLPLLSTYLGHVDPVSTYWYLNPRELHQPSEKPQVTRSARASNRFRRPSAQAC